jgi:hypothetical protein
MTEIAKVMRVLLPAYVGKHEPLTLFRGELEKHYLAGEVGMSWTRQIDVARIFARRRCPHGAVLRRGNAWQCLDGIKC